MRKITVTIEYKEAYGARDLKPIDVFKALSNFAPHKIIGVFEVFEQKKSPCCGGECISGIRKGEPDICSVCGGSLQF